MTVIGHTPGPWVYEGTINGTDICIGPQVYWEHNGRPEPIPMQCNQAVAVVRARYSIEVAGRPDPAAEANARLIAAAPDMLQALRDTHVALRRLCDYEEWGDASGEVKEVAALCARLDAVVAKAVRNG